MPNFRLGSTYATAPANAYANAYLKQGESMATVSITDAATRLGISADTVRRRIGKGILTGHQESTAQGFRWMIELPEPEQETNGHHDSGSLENLVASSLENLVVTLQAQVSAQADELEARRREVSELHVLLQTVQTALSAPKSRPWWRWW